MSIQIFSWWLFMSYGIYRKATTPLTLGYKLTPGDLLLENGPVLCVTLLGDLDCLPPLDRGVWIMDQNQDVL